MVIRRNEHGMKKLSLFLAIVMALSVIPFSGMQTLAATGGAYVYEVVSEKDKTCKIVDCEEGYLDRNLTIPSEINGYKVVEIGAHAFQDAENIKTVTISNGIEVIGEYAFLSCGGITEVVIPNSVTAVREGAFMECKKLATINIPDSVTFVGRNVVYDTQYIQIEVTEPEEDSGTFEIGMGTTTITNKSSWPGGMLYINKHLIMCDPKKTGKVTIKDGTKTIAGDAFFWCDEVTAVTIPSSVVTIGEYAFYQCEKLTGITIPNSVKNIEEAAFSQCYALKNVTIPSSVTKIGDWAFSDCTAFTAITVPGNVKSIGEGAFAYCSGAKSAKIDSGVKSIGGSAFYGCSALSSISIPDSVTSIGPIALDHTAFYKSSGNWSNNVLYVGKFLIKIKPAVTGAFTIKSGTTVVADDAFTSATELTSVSIPSSVTRIADGAFKRNESLKSIKVADDNGKYASSDGCLYNKALTRLVCVPAAYTKSSYTTPNTVTEIADFAIYKCKNLSSVVITDKVANIGKYVIYDCDKIKDVTVDGDVNKIGNWTFYNCEGIKVHGKENSLTEDYCNDNNIPFAVKSAEEELLMGDSNGNGKIESIDAREVLLVVAGLVVPTEKQKMVMDTNGDGRITSSDARWILQKVAGII